MEPSYPLRANVEPRGHRSLAWCNPCADGLRGTLAKCEAWAAQHNMDRHSETTEASEEVPC